MKIIQTVFFAFLIISCQGKASLDKQDKASQEILIEEEYPLIETEESDTQEIQIEEKPELNSAPDGSIGTKTEVIKQEESEAVEVIEQEEVEINSKEILEEKKIGEQESVKEEMIEEILQEEEIEEKVESLLPDHSLWDRLLGKFVDNAGNVNYTGFKNEEARLDQYLQNLKSNPIQKEWSRNEKMAFWINAYNAFTVKLILDNYPVSSIMKIHGGKAWDVKWIEIGKEKFSLNQIENEILRPVYKDARIHFAVNCAAKSCPPLYNRAFTADNLESSLDMLTRRFINDQSFNQISSKRMKISRIFEWYSEDFGNLKDYFRHYSNKDISEKSNVEYAEYNWDLNSN